VDMIGVLDLQGDVVEHIDHLNRLGIAGIRVKKPSDFAHLAGLIIPGGVKYGVFPVLVEHSSVSGKLFSVNFRAV